MYLTTLSEMKGTLRLHVCKSAQQRPRTITPMPPVRSQNRVSTPLLGSRSRCFTQRGRGCCCRPSVGCGLTRAGWLQGCLSRHTAPRLGDVRAPWSGTSGRAARRSRPGDARLPAGTRRDFLKVTNQKGSRLRKPWLVTWPGRHMQSKNNEGVETVSQWLWRISSRGRCGQY